MLLIFFGQIGTGKTSVAKEVAKKLDYEFVNFDNIVWSSLDKRKIYSDKDEFLLTLSETQQVYDSMHKKAESFLKGGKGVVLESMYFKKQRDEAIQLANKIKIPYFLIEVVCDEKVIKRRLEKRKKEDLQTAGFELYLQYRDLMEDEDSKHLLVDTSDKTIEEATDEVIEKLNQEKITF